jgi:hypothetical protein
MGDFKLDIEVKVTVKPVDPKVGTTQRGPWERNLYIVKENKSTLYHNVDKATVAALIPNAVAAIAEQQALGVKPPKVVGVLPDGIPSATTISLAVTGDNQGVSTVPTCEYGTTTALGTSQAATVSPDVSADGTNVDYAFNLTGLTASTKYYWRAKVVSASGTQYGPLRSFTTTNV